MTSTQVPSPAPAPSRSGGRARHALGWWGRLGRVHRIDALVAVGYLALAGIVCSRLWMAAPGRVTTDNVRDHTFFQFVFTHAARAVTEPSNPLFSTQLNAPLGVNMMANTSMLGISLPFVPVTLVAGPAVSFVLAVMLGLAATALAWYVFLRRHVTRHRLIAFVAAGLCGFAPGLVSQTNGHPNIVAQFMVPLILSRVIRLREDPARHGVVLGLMVTYQAFINEEVLLLTAFAAGLVAAVWALSNRGEVRAALRPFGTGLGLAAAVATALLAYPLWFQFFGPQHYRGPFSWAPNFGIDLLAFPAYSQQTVAGHTLVKNAIVLNPAEANAFLGWPLCVLALAIAIAFWRTFTARAAAVVAVVFAVMSLGNTVTVNAQATAIPGPWRALSWLPLLDSLIVSRLALAVAPAVAVLLAVAGDWLATMLTSTREPGGGTTPAAGPERRTLIVLACGAAVAVLLPIGPTPTRGTNPEPVPEFFTAGAWQAYVDGGTLVPVPPDVATATPMRWLVSAGQDFRLADGYFVGPTSAADPTATFGRPPLPTQELLAEVAHTGAVPAIDDEQRRQALLDLAELEADVLVLAPRPNEDAIRRTVAALLGQPGESVGGVWAWDVRGLV
jgi:hypothetical protein